MAATYLNALHDGVQRARENFFCTRNSPRELNQTRHTRRMGEEKPAEHGDACSLLFDIKQNARRGRERLADSISSARPSS